MALAPQPPALISAPPSHPGQAPHPTLGGAPCHHWRGRPAIWTSLPQPGLSLSAGALQGLECEVAWQAGEGRRFLLCHSGRLPRQPLWTVGCPLWAP